MVGFAGLGCDDELGGLGTEGPEEEAIGAAIVSGLAAV